MFGFLKERLKRQLFAAIGVFTLSVGISHFVEGADPGVMGQPKGLSTEHSKSWKKFHSVHGKCLVSLPDSPEHVKQVMPCPDQGYDLRYDMYVSSHGKKAIYMLLIAQYPPFIDSSHAEISLESFLNGLLTQSHDNKLIFADLVNVQGHKALDFFIESKGVFFKGRAIMTENNLYLLAMECNVNNYTESHFNHFINSFELIK